MNRKKRTAAIVAAVIGGVFAVCLAALVIVSTIHNRRYKYDTDPASTEPYSAPELAFAPVDGTEPLPLDTYELTEIGGTRQLQIYDADYLDLFLDFDSVTAEEIKRTVRANPGIGDRFKDLLCKYVDAIAKKYPQADLRVLYYNLQTLEVVERTSHELAFDAMSLSAYGCYKAAENKIYVNSEYQYEPGTWEYQVLMHEFGHAARSVMRTIDGATVRVLLSKDYMEIPEEALNSIFTVSLFDYEERDIAYQLQSNMFLVFTECLDGYSLGDYLNHSLSYLARMMDAQNHDVNYAMTVFRLMQEQRTDYIDDRYERPQETYYPIYDYLCKMYLDHYAPGGGAADEIERLTDALVEKVMYDVPEEYHIDVGEFYRFANAYAASRDTTG